MSGLSLPVSKQTSGFKSFVMQYPLLSMYLITFILAWAYFVPKALYSWGFITFAPPDALGLVAGWTPAIGAAVVTGIMHGRKGIRELFGRYLIWRVQARWYAFVLTFFVPIILGALGLHMLLGGQLPEIGALTMQWWEILLSFLVQVLVLMLLNGEEVGWRAFALPILQARYSSWVAAALLVGIPETLLHAPGFFFKDDPFIASVGIFSYVMFSIALSIIYAWTYLKTGGSLLLLAMFHASQNAWGNLLTDSTARPFHIVVVLLWVIAGVILISSRSNPADEQT